MKLRVNDDDKGTVTVTLNGGVLKSFAYGQVREQSRWAAMEKAQWFREGVGVGLDLDDPAEHGPSDSDLPTAADLEGRRQSQEPALVGSGRGYGEGRR